jgi:cation:H+ antiporter
MLLQVVLLIVGFALLLKGGDWLVDGASGMARRLGISDLVIGLTVVSFGTSAPELVVSLMASLKGSTEITIGNVIGSNIANVLLILGVSALIYPLLAASSTVWKEIPFMLLASVVLTIMANDMIIDGAPAILTRSDGLILLSFFAIFLYYIARVIAQGPAEAIPHHEPKPMGKALLLIGVGLAMLVGGGHLVVTSAVFIATAFGISETLIGLTVVAIGTSLPELATSAIAAWKKNADIAVGNVVGSNIFNVLLVLGISSTVSPLPFEQSANADVAVMLVATLMLFAAMLWGRPRYVIQRGEGAIFLLAYVAYLAWAIWRG